MLHENLTQRIFNHAIAFTVGALLVILFCLPGCSAADKDIVHTLVNQQPTPVVLEVRVINPLQAAQKSLGEARVVVSEMTPANVDATKPVALVKIDAAAQHQADALAGAGVATDRAKKDEKTITSQGKEIENLKAKDPLVSWLRWIGAVLIVGGFASLVFGFIKSITILIEVGAGALGVGIAAVTLAATLPTIILIAKWGIAVIAVVVVAWLAWRWYRAYKAGESVVDSIDVAITSGAITMTDQLKTLLNEWQSKDAKALVDSAQTKEAT